VYARYDKGLKVNVDKDDVIKEQTIKIDGVDGISCEGCKVNMGVTAELAFFFEMNTDPDPDNPDEEPYVDFELWTDVDADFDYNIDFRVKDPKVVLPDSWGTPKIITADPVTVRLPTPYDILGWKIEPSFEISVKGSFGMDGEASLTSMMDTDAGAWARYLKSEEEFKYGLVGNFEAKGPKLEVTRPFTLKPDNHLYIKFKPMFKHTLEVEYDGTGSDTVETTTGRKLKVGLVLGTDYPVDRGFNEGECGTSFAVDSLVDVGVLTFPEGDTDMLWSSKDSVGQVGLGLMDPLYEAPWCMSSGGGDASATVVESVVPSGGGGGGGGDDDEGLDAAGTAGVVVGVLLFVLLASFGLVYYWYRRDEKAVEVGFTAWAASYVSAPAAAVRT